jgi:hypothetical protein
MSVVAAIRDMLARGLTVEQALIAAEIMEAHLLPRPGYGPRNNPDGWTARLPTKQWRLAREAVFERDGYQCNYCGDAEGPFAVDHIIPVTRAGSNNLENLCVSCKPCNSSKGDKLVSEWRGRQ